MAVIARMTVQNVETHPEHRTVFLSAVYSDDPESPNYSFSKWTPTATLVMTITNPDAFSQFEVGRSYDLTFTLTA